jgi:protein transport protein SEC9
MGPGGPGGPSGPGSGNDWESGRGANYGNYAAGNYGAYEERQLTAEEQEEEDVQGAKQEIKFIKQQDVASTRNAVRILAMAEESGRQTLERLGAQGESIHNTERNLDLASNQNKLAAEKARELKTLNRSMFAVHVANPFTSAKRVKEREEQVLADADRDRQQRESVRKAAWDSSSRQQDVSSQLGRMKIGAAKANLSERAKYQFEAVSVTILLVD